MDRVQIVQSLVGGILMGGVYALLASGLALIFGVMRVINFAQADYMMIGMFAAFLGAAYLDLDPILIAIPISIVVAFIGFLFARTLLENVPRGDHNSQLILTLGASLVFQNIALMIAGPTPRVVVRPYTNAYLMPWDLFVNEARLYAFCASLVVMVLLYLFLTRTWTGRAMRATADDPMPAAGVGIDVRRTHVLAFSLGSGLAGLAGALLSTFHATVPTVGNDYIVIMFLAVVMGGLGSLAGAAVSAFVVGLVQSISTLLIPLQLQNVGLFVIFILVLVLRPQGLFGQRQRV